MYKVCHMTSAHAPEDERVFFKECMSLAANGYETYLVARGNSYEKNGVHIIGVGEIPTSRRKRMTKGARKVYDVAKALDADIYHFHDPELLPYGLKLKKKGKKVVFDSHESYPQQIRLKSYLSPLVRKIVACLYERYENHVLRIIDGAIIPCTFGGKNPFNDRCKHSSIIANYPILGEFYDYYAPEFPKEPESTCYIGGLTQARGIDQCVEASARAGATLHLAGGFSSAEYQQQVLASQPDGCVIYHGMLDRKQVAQLLLSSQIGLYLLQDVGQYLKLETMGIKAYEYMSMGLPIVMSHSPYNTALMEQYKFGICVHPQNVNEIATAIRYLLDHPEEARQMGENGRRAVKEEFNWGVEEKKLLALYKEILGE